MALTELAVRNVKPKDKPFKLADAGGLFLFVSPSGGRLWRFKYRIAAKEKLLSLGPYPLVSLKTARDARDDAKRDLLAGIDPSKRKRNSQQEATIKADTLSGTLPKNISQSFSERVALMARWVNSVGICRLPTRPSATENSAQSPLQRS